MKDFPDEHHYAWRLIRAARQGQFGSPDAQHDIVTLLADALESGLDRSTLIVELAAIGGRLLTLCDPTAADEVCLA